jgi:hypothetical protein
VTDLWLCLVVTVLVALGAGLAWWAGGPGGRPTAWATPVRVVVIGYVVLEGLGAVILAAAGASIAGPLLIGGAMVAIGLGVLISRRGLGPSGDVASGASSGPIRWPTAIALSAVGFSAYAWLAVEHGIPLLSGDAQAVRIGWTGLRLDLFRWLVPPVAIAAVGLALATGRREARIVAGLAVIAVFGLEILAASRALPFEFGLAALLVVAWAGRRLRIGAWVLVGVAAGAIFLGVLFARVVPEGGFSGPLDALGFAVERTVGRVVLIGPRTVDIVVETFPEDRPFLGGSTYTRWVDRLVGDEPPPALGSVLFELLFPDEPPGGFVAPGVLAEAYANFGTPFALLLMMGLGIAVGVVGRWLAWAPTDPATRALAGLIVVALVRTTATSLVGAVLTIGAAALWWLLVRPGPVEALRRPGGRTER